jgi:hypothetical protein
MFYEGCRYQNVIHLLEKTRLLGSTLLLSVLIHTKII